MAAVQRKFNAPDDLLAILGRGELAFSGCMAISMNITEEDRRAAATVTSSGSGHRFEIQLGHLCNNRCVFCSSGQLTAMKIARPVPIEPVLEALEDARAAGATHLTFLGGEPTIHKRFLDALAKAVELGFEHIVIFTNGVMFPHPGFIESVVALGNFEWRISIQGANEEAHVATTERPQSFQRILHGLGELKRRGQLVTANMCVNDRSYRSLPDYPELIEKYGVTQLHVDIVRPESTGERNEEYLSEIMPRYSDMAPYYEEMLAGFEKWNPDFDINVGNLPYCILPKWGSRIHHGGQETVTKSSDGEGLEDEMNKYEWQASLRTHLPTCDSCVFRSRCTGIFRVYLELHGGDEFVPLTREDLLAIDSDHLNFVLLAEPLLAGLRESLGGDALPQGWRLVREVTEDRRRLIEVQMEHTSGAPVLFRFLRPGSADAPVIRMAEYDMEVSADHAVSAEELGGLLRWVRDQLASAPDLLEVPQLFGDAVERALSSSVLQRGRQRVTMLAGRLHHRFALPGWNLEQLRWPSQSTGAVTARGPAGAHLDLRFNLAVRGNRSQVGVDFKLAEETDQDSARVAVDHLVALLRDARAAAPAQP